MPLMMEAFEKAGFTIPPPEPLQTSPSLCIVCGSPAFWPDNYCSMGCELLHRYCEWQEELDRPPSTIVVRRKR